MKIQKLLQGISLVETNVDMDTQVSAVYYDSRQVTPGSLFVAVSGFAADGNRFIPMALEKGAVAVVTARKPEGEIPYILVENDRLALAMLGVNFYGAPARSMTMIGITGTNGKTSTTLLLKHVLEQTRQAKVGLVGTMFNLIGQEEIPTERTTPESLELQGLFARMRDAGCTYGVMEVSSHAIALERVGGVRYDVAAFTNLTEDHLDFHKTMENYCDTKAELFARCDKAVANCDDPWFDRVTAKATCPVLTTSVQDKGGLNARDVELLPDGVRFTVCYEEQKLPVRLGIPGKFTVYNALTVLGIALQLGIGLEEAVDALATAPGVKGRVEVVPTPGKPYTVLIDYAHTPDGLENVLSSVRSYCQGRLIAVFGCGGDRDPIKRPIMGRIGTQLADLAIITSDNPRTEDPMAIIRDICVGADETGKTYKVICDRRKAIEYALTIVGKKDIIILAGKGHETYQEINHVKYHLDEREEVARILAES